MKLHPDPDRHPGKPGKTRTSFGIDPASGKLAIGSWRMRMPKSRLSRILVGLGLVLGGLLGFLPVLGFWMLPLGFLVLSHDLAFVRRWRRRLALRLDRRRQGQGRARG